MDTTAVVVRGGTLPSLESMRERMQYQKEMRALLIEYVRSEMNPEQDFYTIPSACPV